MTTISKFTRIAIALSLSACLLNGCMLRRTAPSRAIPLVQDIIEGKQPALSSVLESYDSTLRRGDIVIIDSPMRAAMLSEAFMTADSFDNIDGSRSQDHLPDFAGECITAQFELHLEDSASVLRQEAVMALLSALDSSACYGSYDREVRSSKPKAKVVVLASASMAQAARFDIDTLMSAMGRSVPVVYPAAQMVEAVAGHSVAVIADSQADCEAYQRMLPDSFVCSSDAIDSGDPLHALLSLYAQSGASTPLERIIIDTYTISEDALRSEYTDILLVDSEDNVAVRESLSKDFDLERVASCATASTYSLLRERNIFTHDIAYPMARAYMTNPELSGHVLMPVDWSLLPVGLENDIMSEAGKTYSSYVQN